MKRITLVAASLMLAVTAIADTHKPTHSKTLVKSVEKEVQQPVTLKVDPAASKVVWVGKKLAGSHTGSVGVKEGEFQVKNNGVTKGEIVIDLKTITNEDVKDADYNKKLVEHLKGPDFFDVEKYPTATFKIDSFQEVKNFAPGEPNALAKGKLTMHGVTKPYEAKLFFNPTETGYAVKGKLEIERTQYGLKYNSKKFFDPKALGDKMIDDKFEVNLDLVAKK